MRKQGDAMRIAGCVLFLLLVLAVFLFFVPHNLLNVGLFVVLLGSYAAATWRLPLMGLCLVLALLPVLNNIVVMRYTGYFPPSLLMFLMFSAVFVFKSREEPQIARIPVTVRCPLVALIALAAGSGIIGLLRYSRGIAFPGCFEIHIVNLFMETNADAMRGAFATALTLISGPMFFFMCIRLLKDHRTLLLAIASIAAGLAISVVIGICQAAFGAFATNTEHFSSRGQLNATFIDPNALGSYFALALPLLILPFLIMDRRWVRTTIVLLAIAALYVLIESGSRTGLASLLAAGILLFVRAALFLRLNARQGSISRRTLLAGPAVLFLLICVAITVPPVRHSALGQRLRQSIDVVRVEGPIGLLRADRFELWERAIEVTGMFPLTGVGIGCFRTEVPNLLEWRHGEYRDNAANYYLQIAAELGFIGLAVVLLVYALLLKDAVRLAFAGVETVRDALVKGLPAILLITMLAAFITGPHTNPIEVMLLFWFVLALIYGLPRIHGGAVAFNSSPERRCHGMLAVIIGLHLALFALISATSLSVKHQLLKYGIPASAGFHDSDFSPAAGWSSWTEQSAWAVIPENAEHFKAMLYVGHRDAAVRPVTVSLWYNSELLAAERFSESGARDVRVKLPDSQWDYGILRIEVDRMWIPAESTDSGDSRELGVLVSEVVLE